MLLAPAASGGALVGAGGSEAAALIDWERRDVAALLDADAPLPGSLRADLGRFPVALACTRGEVIAARLRTVIPRVAAVDPAPPPGLHAAEWYRRALAGLGIAPPSAPPPSLEPSAEERAAAGPWRERLGRGFLAVHPGSGSPAKNWPADRYARLARALAAARPWLLVEGPADAPAAEELAAVPGAVRARSLPLRALAALLADAGLAVGNDSGVTHLAAACGSPTLALFGPTDPAQWAPVGPRVAVLRAPGGAMVELEVDEVLETARGLR